MPTFTMRMSDDEHRLVQAVALLSHRSMAEVVREALDQYVRDFANTDPGQRRYEQEQRKRDEAEAALAKLRNS
jgi:predicted transcriptional regulator